MSSDSHPYEGTATELAQPDRSGNGISDSEAQMLARRLAQTKSLTDSYRHAIAKALKHLFKCPVGDRGPAHEAKMVLKAAIQKEYDSPHDAIIEVLDSTERGKYSRDIHGLVRFQNDEVHLTDGDMYPVCGSGLRPEDWAQAVVFKPHRDSHDDAITKLTCTQCRGYLSAEGSS